MLPTSLINPKPWHVHHRPGPRTPGERRAGHRPVQPVTTPAHPGLGDKPVEFGTAASKLGRSLIIFLRARSSSADETWAVHTVFRKESDAALITGQARVRCHSLAQPPGRRPRSPRSASLAVHLSENNTGCHFTSFSMRARCAIFICGRLFVRAESN